MAGYLLDTNSIIYFFNGEEKIAGLIEKPASDIAVSFISKIELLCFQADDPSVLANIAEFLDEVHLITIDDEIIDETIKYRRELNIKIPDAIIAATAKTRGLTLVTADRTLARKVKDIKTVSPL